jgi:hypothetical protein
MACVGDTDDLDRVASGGTAVMGPSAPSRTFETVTLSLRAPPSPPMTLANLTINWFWPQPMSITLGGNAVQTVNAGANVRHHHARCFAGQTASTAAMPATTWSMSRHAAHNWCLPTIDGR